MSVDYKYFIREFPDKESLRSFIEDEMNRPDSLDEIVSVVTQPDGLLLAVGRSRRQARGSEHFNRGASSQREHERFQGGTNFPDPPPPGHRRPRHGGGGGGGQHRGQDNRGGGGGGQKGGQRFSNRPPRPEGNRPGNGAPQGGGEGEDQ